MNITVRFKNLSEREGFLSNLFYLRKIHCLLCLANLNCIAMNKFKLATNFQPTGDQPQAIRELTEGLWHGNKFQ